MEKLYQNNQGCWETDSFNTGGNCRKGLNNAYNQIIARNIAQVPGVVQGEGPKIAKGATTLLDAKLITQNNAFANYVSDSPLATNASTINRIIAQGSPVAFSYIDPSNRSGVSTSGCASCGKQEKTSGSCASCGYNGDTIKNKVGASMMTGCCPLKTILFILLILVVAYYIYSYYKKRNKY